MFNGKLVTKVLGGMLSTLQVTTSEADMFVQNDTPFISYKNAGGPPVSYFKNDDSTPINVETQCVDISEVPDDMTSVFLVEIAFIQS